MNNISKLGQEFGQYMIQLTSELFLRTGQPRSLSEMERNIRMMLLKVGQFLLSSWLALQENSTPVEAVQCPHCGAQAQYRCRREGTLLTILGQVSYKRAYYLCPACQHGHYPLDQQLGLRPGQISAELESLSGMTGAQLPFGQGSQLFEALTLIAVSDHTLAKATQAVGQEVQALELEWMAQSCEETGYKSNNAWLKDRNGSMAPWMRPKFTFGVKKSIPGVT